jgi:hypothetical protein
MANLRANKITSTEVFETTGSVQFDGSGDALTVPAGTDFAYGTGDFTVEAWVYQKSSTGYQVIFAQAVAGTNYFVLLLNSGVPTFYSTLSGGGNAGAATGSSISTNIWNHIAVTRQSGTVRVFVNGIAGNSVANTIDLTDTSYVPTIGAYTHGGFGNSLNGHISNLRILKGTALYTKNFTPPTRELTVIPNTVLLACQSTTNTAQEATGKTITVNGNAVANELTPGLLTDVVKSGGTSAITGSVEFDGTGDYLQIVRGSNTDFEFGTQDFTIEFFAYFAKTGMRIMSTGDNGNFTTGGWVFETNNQFGAATSSGTFTYFGTFTYPINSWAHISVVRNGSNIYGFVNGIQQWSNTISTNISFSGTNDFSLGTGRSGSSGVGDYNLTASLMTKGFISNLRVIKGTALYTSDFIPPTRELKNIPGTVLLCCKDSNDPTAEETGKTITGYGDLQTADGVELIANGHFSSNTDNWTAVGNASLSTSSGQIVLTGDGSTAGGGAAQGFATIVGKKYVLKYEAFSGTISAGQIRIGTSANSFSITFDNSVSASAHDDITFIATSTTTYVTLGLNAGVATSGTFKYDNVSVTLVDGSNKGSNFTPQVGSDGSVEFAGPTKINSENYFYLPTGNTESRGRGRGVFGGGDPGATNNISFIEIQSTGNAQDFGDLTQGRLGAGGFSSSSRGVFSSGYNAPLTNVNTIDYITISTTSNAVDFGDSTEARHEPGACSSSTRGVVGGGTNPGNSNVMDYVTTASLGNAQDFGDLTVARRNITSAQSPTRGIFFGGRLDPGSVAQNFIDYITIATTGNALDFGDLTTTRGRAESVSNATRAVCIGGENPSAVTTMEYVTMSSTGNSVNFGTCSSSANNANNGASNSVRGVFHSASGNTLDYITIAATGNTTDFGDLNYAQARTTAFSDSHGGIEG